MEEPQVVDVAVLAHEVQRHYAEVATTPEADFHLHTERTAAKQVGYHGGLVRGLPDGAVEAFAGVAIRAISRDPCGEFETYRIDS